MTTEIATPKRHGLAVLLDVLVAPSAAFAELRAVPHWGWAFLLTCVLGMIGAFLQVPAAEHVANYAFAHDPKIAALPPDQAENGKKIAMVIQQFAWIFFAINAAIAVALCALCLLLANAIGRGTANFAKLFALSANVAFLNFGIGFLVHGIVAALRGPDGFSTTVDLLGVLPNLGWLAPGAPAKLFAFLVSFTVFQLWSIALIALGMRAIANVNAVVAWSAAIGIAVLGGLFVTVSVH